MQKLQLFLSSLSLNLPKRLIPYYFIVLVVFCHSATAQTTYNPSCNSNAYGWTIERITVGSFSTIVDLKCYQAADYSFFINPGMYIENSNGSVSQKYYVRRFVNNELNKIYSLEGNTEYHFSLEFNRIPSSLTRFNIIEPNNTAGYTGWYWKDISLNGPQKTLDKFLCKSAKTVANLAHPFNTFKSYTLCVNNNKIFLGLYYNKGYYTEFEIEKSGDIFKSIRVSGTNDEFAPFLSLELIRNSILDQPDNENYKNTFEGLLGKTFYSMNGSELACLALTIAWNAN